MERLDLKPLRRSGRRPCLPELLSSGPASDSGGREADPLPDAIRAGRDARHYSESRLRQRCRGRHRRLFPEVQRSQDIVQPLAQLQPADDLIHQPVFEQEFRGLKSSG